MLRRVSSVFVGMTFLAAASAPALEIYALRGHNAAVTDAPPAPGEIVRIQAADPSPAVVLPLPQVLVFAAFDPKIPRMFLASRTDTDTRLYVADLHTPALRPIAFDTAGATFAYDAFSRRLLAVRDTDLLVVDEVTGAATIVTSLGVTSDLLAVDGRLQRAYIADRVDETPETVVRVVDLAAKSVSGPLTLPRQQPRVLIDADGSAYVLGRTDASSTDVFLIDPLTNGVTTLATDVFMRSDHPAIDVHAHLIYGSSWADFNLSYLVTFDVVTRVSKNLGLVTGDTLDLGFPDAQTVVITRGRAVRH